MALIRQTDRRTGTVYVYEAEARWDPKRKQSRYGRRRLVGHVDPGTGEVVPNRPTRASAPSPASRRESCNVFCQVVLNKWDCAVLIEPGCVNPILIRRGNTLLPRQPIRRTWGQLGEQLDRVVGAAGFVHRRKTKEAIVSE